MAQRSMLALSITPSMCEPCSLFVYLDVALMSYPGPRFTKAGRGLRVEWSRRYPHWACDIAKWVLSSFTITLLRGAWSREDGGRRVAVGVADRTVTIWDVESSKILYKVRCVIYFSLDITPILVGSFLDTRVPSQRWIFILKNRSVRNSLCR